MTRSLRQKHRFALCTLGILLPVAFVSGIVGRRSVPIVESLPAQLAGQGLTRRTNVWTKSHLWPGQQIVTSLEQDSTGSAAVELQTDLLKPDVLVYWNAGNNATTTVLPETARLLGALRYGSPLAITSEMTGRAGQFLLYSLADHEIVAVSKPFML